MQRFHSKPVWNFNFFFTPNSSSALAVCAVNLHKSLTEKEQRVKESFHLAFYPPETKRRLL